MPCDDITEKIKLTLNDDNRIESYSFSKKTCGGGIGLESLLLDDIGGQFIEDIINNNSILSFPAKIDESNIESYLRLKHLYAIQTVLNVYLGKTSGGVNDSCTIAAIEYDENETVIQAEIKIDLATNRIKLCDHCGLT